MESFYLAIALLTAGVSLLSGILHLMSGLARDGEKSELTFGIISLSVFIFLVLPPTGFILGDRVPYSLAIDIKRIFIWTYYGTLPWFIEYYSGYKKRPLTYAVEIFLAASYVVMLFTHEGRTVWFWLSRAALGIILYYGVVAGIKMLHTHQHKEAKWLLATMVIYGALLLLSTINQIGNNFLGRMMGTKTFFPIHLNMLAFIVLMSIRLRTNAQEKFRLQKALSWGDTRWNMLVNNMHLMILELDTGGVVRYANPYAVKKLGYHSEADLLGKNWFECFALSDEAPVLKNLYLESVEEQKLLTHFTSRVRISAEKRLVVNWTNVFLYNRDDSVRGIMTIGIDNTERENAFELVQQLKNELEKENLLLKGQPAPATDNADIIGQSDAILYAIQKAKQVAVTNAGVLLLGETGTGKEQFANLIHRNSYRINKPLVKVNCAALPAELIESELFGHEKGSFTGAATARKGKFELADGGTLFLDEVGELPLALQPKLLRVLQSGEFERIGGQVSTKVNVRIIAATNRNLQEAVKAGKFREDLFYRLNVFPITLLPLRQRKEDIPLLISHFVEKYAAEQQKKISDVSKADLSRLTAYAWPGNIRELINLVERSVIISQGPTLQLDWYYEQPVASHTEEELELIEDVERAHILKILKDCHWKINGEEGAAAKLGLHPNTLRSRLKKLHIERERI